MSIASNIASTCKVVSAKLSSNAPKIAFIGGIIGVVGSVIGFCVATKDSVPVVEKAKADLNNVQEQPVSEEYTEEDKQHDTNDVYRRTIVAVAKRYLPAVCLLTVSLAALICAHNIQEARNVALAAAYSTVVNNFDEYRKRVRERYGEQADDDILNDRKKMLVERKTVDEDGNEVTETEEITVSGKPLGQYTFRYEKYDWQTGEVAFRGALDDPYANRTMLKGLQRAWNNKFDFIGTVFVNDIMDDLNHDRLLLGQSEGWHKNVNDPDDDAYIDFSPRVEMVLDKDGNPYECCVITLNVMGNVLSSLAKAA